MSREIRFNAFMVGRPVHQSPGLWRHPRDRSTSYKQLSYWVETAQLLERGLFDAIFLADGIGPNVTCGGNIDAALRHGTMIPTNDPWSLIPAMAFATQHLGFAVTGNLSFEAPYLFARRISTLDQLTNGRLGWNIVTGSSASGARGMGRELVEHDTRYDIGDEFMSIVYRLWEDSWEDDAVKWDAKTGVFADPSKVHSISHHGTYFDIDAVHLTEPSPQRTPVLFQAGSSERGRRFAADHAECVFLSGPSKTVIARVVRDVRERAAAQGRDPSRILFFPMMTIIVGETEEAAKSKLADYQSYISYDAAIVLFSAFTGIDYSTRDPDSLITYEKGRTGPASAIESFTTADPDRKWTLREVANHIALGGRGPLLVGSPTQVADELQGWMQDTDVDGFNLAYVLAPETYTDIVNLLIPELQRRGVYKTEYRPGTLREKLFGEGHAHIESTHRKTLPSV